MIYPLDFRSPGVPAQPTRWDLASVTERPGDLFGDGFGGGAMIADPSAEAQLREKLRKIETLFAGAATAGEKAAAGAAADRIRARLGKAAGSEAPEEIKFSVPDSWSRQLFIALCRRYGINPFRYRRMHRQTVIVRAPRSFVEQVLWPEFQELSAALSAYLAEITDKLIREEVHGETADAEERDGPGSAIEGMVGS